MAYVDSRHCVLPDRNCSCWETVKAMKIRLDRYILGSVLKVGIISVLLCSLVLVSVDLLSNLEQYIQLAIPAMQIILRSLYYLPEAVLISLGPAFLFSITYYLSMLQANNEMICLLNSGIPYRRIIRPILFLALLVSAFYFLFNETVGIEALKQKQLLEDKFFLSSSSYDSRNVTLNDRNDGFLLFARKYTDTKKQISNTVLISKSSDGKILWKMNSDKAIWNSSIENWEFTGNTIYQVDGDMVYPRREDVTVVQNLDISPELFRNVQSDIKTMELPVAWDYLQKIQNYDHTEYNTLATDFYQRLFSCLTPFVLMLIACSINYRFKKNVLLFSIICCLCIGVIYYVVQMLSLIMANQGMISPMAGMLVPFALILVLSLGMISTFRT